MIRQTIGLFFIVVTLNSCQWFGSNKTVSSSSDLKLIDTIIDFTKVDVYPIFSDCENYAENDNQKECFETSLIDKLTDSFSEHALTVKKKVNEKTSVDILIDQSGKAFTVAINSPEIIHEQLPTLDSIIRQSILDLPTMKPAVKRGIFVKSQYRLVVVVKTI